MANDSNIALQLGWDTPFAPLQRAAQLVAANTTCGEVELRDDRRYAIVLKFSGLH